MSLSSSSLSPSSTFSPTDDFPSPSLTGSPALGNTTSSASLYLYTFLATLVLLLSVSAAIVLRSLILRRRHAAMMAEAIRNGTYIPPTNTRGPKIDPSQKPPMYEAHLVVRQHDDHHLGGSDAMKPGPLSLSYIIPRRVRSTTASTSIIEPHERVRRVIWSHFSSDSAPPVTKADTPLESSGESLRVSMLVAMPCQYYEGGGLPHIEIGVVEVTAEYEKHTSFSEDSASRV
ncbi:hypothetical protein CPB85DRAFT_1328205 [Mucidula mucida]|nr:hypothetical protein CPB85DRAFT_1328205 [Mucidula mucida]